MNLSGHQDEDGAFSDWIELQNTGDTSIDLEGWSLTDDQTDVLKWRFPSVILQPGAYQVVFASGKNRSLLNGELHTNFQLDTEGEYLALFCPRDTALATSEFAPAFPDQYADVAYADLSGSFDHTIQPTPGAANVSAPIVSPDQALQINEFVASNTTGLQDEDDAFPDWIELYNPGPLSVNLSGWGLSDDPGAPYAWIFPDITMDSGDYLVVFASGKDRRPLNGAPLHTDFKLSRDGDFVGLYAPLPGPAVDEVEVSFPPGSTDLSFGRINDGETSGYFEVPTPGASNGEGDYGDVATPPQFSLERGFHEGPVTVTLSTDTANGSIRYTLDGSAPSTETGNFYTGPLTFTENTVLRAVTVGTDMLPSRVVTHTYLLDQDSAIQSLPFISIAGDEEESLYEPNGVMAIVGGHYEPRDDWYEVWVSDGPGDYNNALLRGRDFERPVSIELAGSTEEHGFQTNGGIRVHGSDWHRERYFRADDWTGCTGDFLNYGKFSFKVYFRNDYDGPLEYALFEESTVDTFDQIILRGGHNDTCDPFVRDELSRRLHKDMGYQAAVGRMTTLFINGEYKGYYNPAERIDQSFMQRKFGNANEWDVITEGSQVRDGDDFWWQALLDYVRTHDLSQSAFYEEVEERMEIDDFIDYLILQLYTNNSDWPNINWIAARPRRDAGKFKFFVWDSEFAMRPSYLESVGFNEYPQRRGTGLNGEETPIAWLYQALKPSEIFRLRFQQRVQLHLFDAGALAETNVERRFFELRDTMSALIPDMSTFIPETFIPQRHAILLDAFEAEGLY
jgi:hypothetical protein